MDLFNNLELRLENNDVIVILHLNQFSTEFASELHIRDPEKQDSLQQKVRVYIKERFPHLTKATVKVVAGSIIVATFASMPLDNKASAHEVDFNMGYLYFGGPSSFYKQIENTKGNINTASPSYFDLNAYGSLKITNQLDPRFISEMHRQGKKVVPFVSNHWDRNLGIKAINNREQLATQIAQTIEQYDLDGVNVDIENVTHNERNQYTDFVRLLREKIPAHKEVSVAVAVNPNDWQTGWHGSYDYKQLALYSDYLMLMAYDESFQGGPEGPIASLPWVARSIEYALNQGVPEDKIVLGLPFFGRYWKQGSTTGGAGISNIRVEEMISKYESTVVYDEAAQSPKAIIKIKETDQPFIVSGKTLGPGTYHIWYENERSIKAKVGLVHEYNIKGTGSWSLGQENPTLWDNYAVWLQGHGADSTPVDGTPSEPDQPTAPEKPIATTTSYTVSSGDTLFGLASRFNTSVSAIKSLNNLTSDVIFVGQKLKIPTLENSVQPTEPKPVPDIPTDPKPIPEQETVKPKPVNFGKYFEVVEANVTVYDNSSGKLVPVGSLQKGEIYPRTSDYGDWHKIQYGSRAGFVYKPATKPATGESIRNENKGLTNKAITVIAKEKLTVYDNSTGKLVPFASLLPGAKYPIVSDYGADWYRILLANRVGYIYKGGVELNGKTPTPPKENTQKTESTQQNIATPKSFGKYFQVIEDNVTVYDNSSGKLVPVGSLKKGQIFPRISDYGDWHKIQYGNKDGFVYKPATKPATGSGIHNENKTYKNKAKSFTATEKLTVYDNSSGKLVPFASILPGATYPIVSDYGADWYRILVSGRVGYVYKGGLTL